jgi:sulfide:quinone oxidoreductase
VLVNNLLAVMQGKGPSHTYDGYASCPLTTSVGKIMLAEFCYDGVVTPSFPFDPRVPRRAYWHLKKDFLPWLYWDILLKGKDWPVTHKARQFKPQVPTLTA